jgi:hypothetical protein
MDQGLPVVTTNTITYPEQNREQIQQEFAKILEEPGRKERVEKAYKALEEATRQVEAEQRLQEEQSAG